MPDASSDLFEVVMLRHLYGSKFQQFPTFTEKYLLFCINTQHVKIIHSYRNLLELGANRGRNCLTRLVNKGGWKSMTLSAISWIYKWHFWLQLCWCLWDLTQRYGLECTTRVEQTLRYICVSCDLLIVYFIRCFQDSFTGIWSTILSFQTLGQLLQCWWSYQKDIQGKTCLWKIYRR